MDLTPHSLRKMKDNIILQRRKMVVSHFLAASDVLRVK